LPAGGGPRACDEFADDLDDAALLALDLDLPV
jgi:hypothetical protein